MPDQPNLIATPPPDPDPSTPAPFRVRKPDPRLVCSNYLAGRVPCVCPEVDEKVMEDEEEEGRVSVVITVGKKRARKGFCCHNSFRCIDYLITIIVAGGCKKGDSCGFAHGVFECWLHPDRYRTQPCKDGLNCRRRICFFAHTPEQLRLVSPRGVNSCEANFGRSSMRHTFDSYVEYLI